MERVEVDRGMKIWIKGENEWMRGEMGRPEDLARQGEENFYFRILKS
jgi:hypothetical protein